uniref:DNA-directed RNA polymerase III subunit n=1 Tax=Panagrolaimus superbus TaxID=310955 RepID=A0A914YBC7_9BILA
MSKPKRDAKNGVRAIASALGIQRHELGAYTRMTKEPPPLFPPILKPLLPAVSTSVTLLDYRCGIQTDFEHYFNSLETNSYIIKDDPVSHRYSDDFLNSERLPFVSAICDLPKGLHPISSRKRLAAKEKAEANAKKAKKMEKLLKQLEAKEKKGGAATNEEEIEEEAKEEGEEEEEQILAGSEEEYFEEDNDYIHAYFDNGEAYNENPSDDNLDDGDGY